MATKKQRKAAQGAAARRAAGSAAAAAKPGAQQRTAAPMDVWDTIAWVCLHVLVIIVPIAMSNLGPFNANGAPLTFDQFDIAKVFMERAIMLIAVGAWLVGVLVRGGRLRWSKVEWLILAFLVWVALTSILSIHPATAILGKYRRFEGLISFMLYASVFFIALQIVDRPSRVRSLARSLAIGGFLVAFYGALQVVGTVSLQVARVLQPAALFLGLAVPVACVWMALASPKDRETRRALVIGAVIAAAGGFVMYFGMSQNITHAVEQGLQVASVDPVVWGTLPFETNRAFSTFGNPDLLGGYLIFPWAIALGLALTEEHRVWRTIYWVFTLFNLFVGITSYVRGAWIGATVALAVLVIAYFRAKKGSDLRLATVDRVFIGTAGVSGAIVALVTSLRPDAVRNVLTRILSIFEFGEGSALTRFQIWDAARAAVAERPIFGWGADTFRLLFPMFKPAEYVAVAGYLSVADNVHNYPLQLATGLGIPGALMLYGLIGWTLVASVRQALARGRGTERLLLAAFWAAALGYVVHLLFGLSVTGSTMFLWLAMGLLLSPVARTHEIEAPAWRSAAVGVVGAAVITASVLNVRFVVADNHFLKGRVLTTGADSIAEIERAIELNPYNDMYRLELGAAWQNLFRASAQEYAKQAAAGDVDPQVEQQVVQRFGEAEGAYRNMIAFVKWEYDTYVFLANLYNEGATYLNPAYADKAIEIAEIGVQVEPYGPAIRLQLAVAHMTKGELDPAIDELEYAVDLDPRYTQARNMLAQAYTRVGRIDDARAEYEAVLSMYPDNAQALHGLESLDASATTTTVP